MRATVGLLKTCLFAVSVLLLILNGRVLALLVHNSFVFSDAPYGTVMLLCLNPIGGVLISVGCLGIGITIKQRLLETSKLINTLPKAIIYNLVANLMLIILAKGLEPSIVIQLVLGLWMAWYLHHNFKYLSVREKSKLKSQ